jgi:hypothetical protein
MLSDPFTRTISLIADFYGGCKYGCEGWEGFRKSTDLHKFAKCAEELLACGVFHPDRTVFADLGCADGRVNVLLSYFVKISIGIEIDQDILDEYPSQKKDLDSAIQRADLIASPSNIFLFNGSSLEDSTYQRLLESTGIRYTEIDLFYTYITLHDLFAEKISREAKGGALYLVYGFNKVLPRYDGLELLAPDVAGQGVAALYVKK